MLRALGRCRAAVQPRRPLVAAAAAAQRSYLRWSPARSSVEAGGLHAGTPTLIEQLKELRLAGGAADPSWLEAKRAALQRALGEGAPGDRIAVLDELSMLASLPGRPYAVGQYFFVFLEEYIDGLGALGDGETIEDRAAEIRKLLRCFHVAGVGTERMRLVYEHIEEEFPRFEAAGALLPMPAAVQLCHTMLATGQSSAPAVTVLLRSASREPLLNVKDDSQELRLLKMTEMLIRLDYLHTQEQLPADVVEYLSVVRDIRFYDRELRRDTSLSYQLASILRKHGFPSKRHMLGPYCLKVCDPEERINFEPVEERSFRHGMPEEPPARKRRHLEAVGWRCFEVTASVWSELATYEAKAAHVRRMLKDNGLLNA